MVGRRGLREPHVARIARELAALERRGDRVAVAQLAARRVDQVGAALELLQAVGIDHVLGLRVQRAVQRHHVADLGQALEAGVVREVELLLDRLGQAVAVEVVQLHVEGLEQPQHAQPDAARGHRAHLHALEVVGARHAVGDVPAALDHPVVRRDVVAHQAQRHHHHVLGHAVAVAVGDLGHRDAAVDRGLQVGMVGADARGHDHLELGCLRDALGRHVGGPEGLRDHDLGVVQLAVEHAVRAVLARGDHELVAVGLEVLAQAQLARDAAQQGAGLEVDAPRRGQRLSVGIALQVRQVVAGVGGGIARHGVVVEHANNLGQSHLLVDAAAHRCTEEMVSQRAISGQSFDRMGR